MFVALTEQFLDDVTGLPTGLEHKCLDLLSSLRKLETKDLQQKAPPGWRLHRLKSSPFVSLSLDMNYRVLCKIEANTVFACRVVKHDLADMPQVNRNANTSSSFALGSPSLGVNSLYEAVTALGVSSIEAAALRGLSTEDELMDALQQVDSSIAELALALYEMTGITVPRTKVTFANSDPELQRAFSGESSDWNIYLHPSQKYLAEFPSGSRLLVSGSAGTGKTVCAWHRIYQIASRGESVGFACSNSDILAVSKGRLARMLEGCSGDVFFLLPGSVDELLQLCDAVQHLVIDEGQEFATTWLRSLASHVAAKPLGLTLFYDLNQLGGNIGAGDTRRYEHRVSDWDRTLGDFKNFSRVELSINYRNSREISQYYYDVLSDCLPNRINSEIPVFSSGEVIEHNTTDLQQVPALIATLVLKLQREFKNSDIGVVCNGEAVKKSTVVESLRAARIPATTDLEDTTGVIVTGVRAFRGHERRAVIVAAPSRGFASDKWGQAINSYIALSRARDRLIVINTGR